MPLCGMSCSFSLMEINLVIIIVISDIVNLIQNVLNYILEKNVTTHRNQLRIKVTIDKQQSK